MSYSFELDSWSELRSWNVGSDSASKVDLPDAGAGFLKRWKGKAHIEQSDWKVLFAVAHWVA